MIPIQNRFNKVLIANRGEIACRIIRTAERLGIQTIAIYASIEPHALHVNLADEGVLLRDPHPQSAYLDIQNIIEIAKQTGAEAIHPGYGFLSENAVFAEAVQKAGLVFVGPSAQAIRAMGLKSEAKALMTQVGVPVIPGFCVQPHEPFEALAEQAQGLGYPLLIKAIAGGGGKGMRLVFKPEELFAALKAVQNEALKAFGNTDVILEPYLECPRHIEIQIACDHMGQGVSLFERDCSWQRRYQKVLEEAPAAALSEDTRTQMGLAALKAAEAVGYQNLGTVEFLLDQKGTFYFMEMNTRLQVEHPITEEMLGLDLVAWQFHLASGFALPLTGEEIKLKPKRHAIEARIYAENPHQDFLPSTGLLRKVIFPKQDEVTRIETGFQTGDDVSIYFDPLIAKVIAIGNSRLLALRHLQKALQSVEIIGPQTNLCFLLDCVKQIQAKNLIPHTHWIEKNFNLSPVPESTWIQIAVQHYFEEIREAGLWGTPSFFSVNTNFSSFLSFKLEQKLFEVRVQKSDVMTKEKIIFSHLALEESGLEVLFYFNHETHKVQYLPYGAHEQYEKNHPNDLIAPMTGSIVEILKQEGESFEKGEKLVRMEAMKMEHALKAPFSGRVKKISVTQGMIVTGGDLVMELEDI